MNVAILDGILYSAKGRHGKQWSSTTLHSRGVRDIWSDGDTITRAVAVLNGRIWQGNGRTVAEYNTSYGRVFAHDYTSSPWKLRHITHENASSIMAMCDSFVDALHVKSMQHSPGYRGVSILAQTRTLHRDWFDHAEMEVSCDAFTPNSCYPLLWQKTNGKTYLHAYDMRGAWLSSARTSPCGNGELHFVTKWDTNREGYWVVEVKTKIPKVSPITKDGVYPTAVVRAAKSMGSNIEVQSGWVWQYENTALRAMVEKIHKARVQLLSTPDRVRYAFGDRMVKTLYTRTFGMLDHKSKERPWAYQPYWYHSLQAESARRIWEVVNLNADTLAVDVDTIYLASPDANPYTALKLPRNGVPDSRAVAIGSWRYSGSMVIPRAMMEATGTTGSNLSLWLRERKCLEDWSKV